MSVAFKARDYQERILNDSYNLIKMDKNPIIELDCGLGKRFLQLSLIRDKFPDKQIILLLQASASLYETYKYLEIHAPKEDITIIDSRIPSNLREIRLRKNRVVLALPQTLANTLKKYPDAINNTSIVLINEVDQIIRRMGSTQSLKIPYPRLFHQFEGKKIIGMSGTLRDEHYVLDNDQMRIKKELDTLTGIIENSVLISMDSLQETDLKKYISVSQIIPTAITDPRMALVSMELELYLEEAKDILMARLLEEDKNLYYDAKSDFSLLFGPLPIEPDIINKFHSGYLARKYLWSMTGSKAAIHLIRYGLDKNYVWNSLPMLPGKFKAVTIMVAKYEKVVVLCSYLDTVNTLDELLSKKGFNTVVISGQVSQNKRAEELDRFRSSEEPMVAILSNVGERDLDIPEAELLIIFDLINTTKTVYQKLKRSRGGECRILYYTDTKEVRKAHNVITKISEKYPWSTEICVTEAFFTD